MLLWFVIIYWVISVAIGLYVATRVHNSKASIFKMVENAYQITLVAAFVPLVGGLYWRRATNQWALAAIFAGMAIWLTLLLVGGDDPFLPAQFAGLIVAVVGMVAGSPLPQWLQHNPHIHDELRHGHLAHPGAGTYHVPDHPHHNNV